MADYHHGVRVIEINMASVMAPEQPAPSVNVQAAKPLAPQHYAPVVPGASSAYTDNSITHNQFDVFVPPGMSQEEVIRLLNEAQTRQERERRAEFTLTLQGNNLTQNIRARLLSLTLTDSRGFEADQLDIELDDSDGLMVMPQCNAVLSLARLAGRTTDAQSAVYSG